MGGMEDGGWRNKREKGQATNLTGFQLASPVIAEGKGTSKRRLIIHEAQFLESLLFLRMPMRIHTVLADRVSICGSSSIRSGGSSIRSGSIVLICLCSEEERTSRNLGSGFFGGCKFLQLIGWCGVGCNTGELDDLFDVDGGAGFDPSGAVVLLVIFLDVDGDIEDGVGVVVSVI